MHPYGVRGSGAVSEPPLGQAGRPFPGHVCLQTFGWVGKQHEILIFLQRQARSLCPGMLPCQLVASVVCHPRSHLWLSTWILCPRRQMVGQESSFTALYRLGLLMASFLSCVRHTIWGRPRVNVKGSKLFSPLSAGFSAFQFEAMAESLLAHSFMVIPSKFMSTLDRSDDHTVVRKTFVGQVQLCTHIVFQTLTR